VILWENLTFWTAVGNVGLGMLAGLMVGLVVREARRYTRRSSGSPPVAGACPVCGTRSLRRLRRRGFERLARVLTRRWPYGCRRCGWRSTVSVPVRVRPTAPPRPQLRPSVAPRRQPRPPAPFLNDIDRDDAFADEPGLVAAGDDEADVKAAVMDYVALLNSGNVQARTKLYRSDCTGFGLDSGPLASGAFDPHTARMAVESGRVFDLRCRDLRTRVHGHTAISTASLVGTLTTSDGARKTVSGRSSWVHLREQGTWKIAHTHLSPLRSNSPGASGSEKET